MKIVIRERPRRGPMAPTVKLEASCDGEECGYIALNEDELSTGARVLDVSMIQVAGSYQRRGVATKLYEKAAQAACRRGLRLASTLRVKDSHSNAFWSKQLAKGRARVEVVDSGGKTHWNAIVLKQCTRRFDLSGTRGRR